MPDLSTPWDALGKAVLDEFQSGNTCFRGKKRRGILLDQSEKKEDGRTNGEEERSGISQIEIAGEAHFSQNGLSQSNPKLNEKETVMQSKLLSLKKAFY